MCLMLTRRPQTCLFGGLCPINLSTFPLQPSKTNALKRGSERISTIDGCDHLELKMMSHDFLFVASLSEGYLGLLTSSCWL